MKQIDDPCRITIMMLDAIPTTSLGHCAIWMHAVLDGREFGQGYGQGEHPSTSLTRIYRETLPMEKAFMKKACIKLVRGFCAKGRGEEQYVQELLMFATCLTNNQVIADHLSGFAMRFKELGIPFNIRAAVLNCLVDMKSYQTVDFWEKVLVQHPNEDAIIVLSGLIGVDRKAAFRVLPMVPDNADVVNAAVCKLDIAYDDTPRWGKTWFVDSLMTVIPSCNDLLKNLLTHWMFDKIGK